MTTLVQRGLGSFSKYLFHYPLSVNGKAESDNQLDVDILIEDSSLIKLMSMKHMLWVSWPGDDLTLFYV